MVMGGFHRSDRERGVRYSPAGVLLLLFALLLISAPAPAGSVSPAEGFLLAPAPPRPAAVPSSGGLLTAAPSQPAAAARTASNLNPGFSLAAAQSGAASVPVSPRDQEPPRVAVVVSRPLRPYVEAAEGAAAVLADSASAAARVQSFALEKLSPKGREALARDLSRERFDLLVAVGPEAVRFVADEIPAAARPPWLYCLVLSPQSLSPRAEGACGVALDIPARRQLEAISQGLPSARRPGLLFDPRYNADFFQRAAAEAAAFGLSVVPLRVSAKREIPAALRAAFEAADALWLVPDQTVISESLVPYVVKEALLRKVPVVGFNRFFYDSGAALAFVFDYEELGRQAGRLAADFLRTGACQKAPPSFRAWLNRRVLEKLGLPLPERRPAFMEVGP